MSFDHCINMSIYAFFLKKILIYWSFRNLILKHFYIFIFIFFSQPLMAQVNSRLSLVSDSFVSSAFEAGEKNTYQFLSGQFKSTDRKQIFYMDLTLGYAFGAPLLSYINPKEFYLAPKLSEQTEFYFGRKLHNWSFVDRNWDLGLFEPTFQWNPLNPQSQGLTGLFWGMNNEKFGFMTFASAVYLPDQGPSFEIQNGKFEAGNPWFRRPPQSIYIEGVLTPVTYDIDVPSMSDVIFRQSFAGQVRIGSLNEGPQLRLSLASKPSNQIAKTYSNFFFTESKSALVKVKPMIYNHTIYSADTVFQHNYFNFGFGYAYDTPEKLKVEDDYTYPEIQPAHLYSPFIEAKYKTYKLGYQFLSIVGGRVKDVGSDASLDQASFTARYPYFEASELYLSARHRMSKKQKIDTRMSYIWSQLNNFSIIKWNSLWTINSMWGINLELSLVEAQVDTADNPNSIYQFRNNDKMLLGVSYVF